MERRGAARIGTALVLLLTVMLTPLGDLPTAHAAPVDTAPPETTVPDAPPVTVSEFFPEEENLSDCLGLVERPGCGSKARGGWHQTAVFGFLVLGLAIIIWRISRGVRANRAGQSPTSPS